MDHTATNGGHTAYCLAYNASSPFAFLQVKAECESVYAARPKPAFFLLKFSSFSYAEFTRLMKGIIIWQIRDIKPPGTAWQMTNNATAFYSNLIQNTAVEMWKIEIVLFWLTVDQDLIGFTLVYYLLYYIFSDFTKRYIISFPIGFRQIPTFFNLNCKTDNGLLSQQRLYQWAQESWKLHRFNSLEFQSSRNQSVKNLQAV